jgi:hypothetical protein
MRVQQDGLPATELAIKIGGYSRMQEQASSQPVYERLVLHKQDRVFWNGQTVYSTLDARITGRKVSQRVSLRANKRLARR